MSGRLEQECARAAERASSLRVRNFNYRIDGDTVRLSGDALTPDGADSVVKLFRATSARHVESELRCAPPDPSRPGALTSPKGFVEVRNLGPDGSRLAEASVWQVEADDTLRSIAETMYGDPEMAIRLVRANPFLSGVDDHIHVGMKLRVPVQ